MCRWRPSRKKIGKWRNQCLCGWGKLEIIPEAAAAVDHETFVRLPGMEACHVFFSCAYFSFRLFSNTGQQQKSETPCEKRH